MARILVGKIYITLNGEIIHLGAGSLAYNTGRPRFGQPSKKPYRKCTKKGCKHMAPKWNALCKTHYMIGIKFKKSECHFQHKILAYDDSGGE